jgi:hypothetical protein
LKSCLLTFSRLVLSVGSSGFDEMTGSCRKAGQLVKGETEMNRLFEAIANHDVLSERRAALGITGRKVYQYLGLFCFLLVIYSICIPGFVKFLAAEPPEGYGFGDLMKPLIGFCLVLALPFGVLAYLDKAWRSSDAASVIICAWFAVYLGISAQHAKLCPMGVAIPLLPFILSAHIAHSVGTFVQPKNTTT